MKKITLSILTLFLAIFCMAQGHHAPFNSSEAVAPAVSELISVFYDKYVADVLNNTKEKNREETQRSLMSVVSDYGRLMILPSDMLFEIGRFAATSLEDSGETVPDAGVNIMFFMPSSSQTKDSSLLYMFMQGQCVGVGSARNGMTAVLAYDSCDPSSFYDVVILAADDESKTYVREVFSSSVMFKLKKEYVFGVNWKKKVIDSLILR